MKRSVGLFFSNMIEFLLDRAGFVIAAFGLIAALAGIFYMAAFIHYLFWDMACAEYSEVTGMETKVRFLSGCYVNYKDEWLHYADYQRIIVAKEGLTNE